MVVTAFLLSIRQLGDPAIIRVFLKSIAVTLLLLATVGVALWWGVTALLAWWGYAPGPGLSGVIAAAVMIGFGWLLFRAAAVAVVGVFADEVVEAVEARHYPEALRTARPVPLARGAAIGLRSAARAIAVNIAAAPLYLLLLVTGIGTPIGFFVVNAWLLGRDLGDMVAARHLGRDELPTFRAATAGRRWLLGAAGTGLLLVPFVNLVAPVLGAAMATHLFHRRLS